ncbi:MAG TPA: hypothetical protein VMJ93_04395 [Verrucomicrobiae bacterium]|nr:hypothetical protein [Verrucomicrobiae bacterium]
MNRLEQFSSSKSDVFSLPKGLLIFLLVLAGAALAPRRGLRAAAPPQGQTSSYTGISVEYSQQLFATMCALDAAGFQSDESTLSEMPARLALRDRLLKMQGPATDAVRKFYHDHEMGDPSQTLSQYMTFAMVAGPPPTFRFRMDQEALPPDVLAIQDFQDVLANFYEEAHLESQWIAVEPEYERAVVRDEAAVRSIVEVSNAYLREITRPLTGRTFTVYVEPLVGNMANFRNFGNNYSIVIGTGSQFPEHDVRHAYLHFVLDPLPLQYRRLVETKSALLNVAAHAPRLAPEYQNDFLAFADECLIRAVELRVANTPPAQLEKVLADDDASGYILVRPFVQQLMKFEKSEPAMTYYFPDLISGIDVAAEQKRLESVKFAPVQTQAEAAASSSLTESRTSALDAELAEGDRDIALRNGEAAADKFQDILSRNPGEPRAVYGLAVASVLMRKVDQAKALFEQVVTLSQQGGKDAKAASVDPGILSWSHVYLARIFELEQDEDNALTEFHAALSVTGAPEAARVAAQKGIDSAAAAPAPAGDSDGAKP